MRHLAFACSVDRAQAQAQLDSLLRVRDALPQDTSRLGVLTELLRATVFNDPDSALVFAAEYRSIAERSGIDLEIGKGHNYTGMCYTSRSEHDEALRHYLAAVPYFERGGDPWYEAMAHNNIGSIHEKMRRYDKANDRVRAGAERIPGHPRHGVDRERVQQPGQPTLRGRSVRQLRGVLPAWPMICSPVSGMDTNTRPPHG
ncbi:MAG: tetratricopeptide repeat protein [Flavobacteriales bacterium]|nr:tetratricopeptide repeat protein [Flavobacteriales bacterium]